MRKILVPAFRPESSGVRVEGKDRVGIECGEHSLRLILMCECPTPIPRRLGPPEFSLRDQERVTAIQSEFSPAVSGTAVALRLHPDVCHLDHFKCGFQVSLI